MSTADEAWKAREIERGAARSCNPETEFRLGFAAGAADPMHWAGLYVVAARRADDFEVVLRAHGINVRDALDPAFVDANRSKIPNSLIPETHVNYGVSVKEYVEQHEALATALAERDAATLMLAEDTVYMNQVEAERDKALAERDASRQVNAEFLAARGDMAAHDREVAAAALEKARDEMMPPYNWNLDPHTGQERPGTSTVDQVYGDVHREMTDMAATYRAGPQADLAAAHTADLAAQSAHYRDAPMNEGVGE